MCIPPRSISANKGKQERSIERGSRLKFEQMGLRWRDDELGGRRRGDRALEAGYRAKAEAEEAGEDPGLKTRVDEELNRKPGI